MNLGYEHTVPSSTVLLDARRVAGGLDDVRAHQQVGQVQRRRLGLVVPDPADPGGEVDDDGRPVVGEQLLGGAGDGEVVVGVAGDDDVGATGPQPLDDPAAEEAGALR